MRRTLNNMTSYCYDGVRIYNRAEAKQIIKWQFIILVCIALSAVFSGLIVQESFYRVFENAHYNQYILKEADRAYQLRFEPALSSLAVYNQKSKIQVIAGLCREYRLNVARCTKDLLAIGIVESNFNDNAVNRNTNGTMDGGTFQINSIHNFSAYGNFAKEARWTIENLLRNGYLENRMRAIGRHHSFTRSLQLNYLVKIRLAFKILE